MKGRKLLAAALLAGMVSSPAIVAEVLSDDMLGEVSAQGFQVADQRTGAATQNVNNDSVQLNGNAQQEAQSMATSNSAQSALNVGQNVAGISQGSSDGVSQRNDQTANSAVRSWQQDVYQFDVDEVNTRRTLNDRQSINNGSVQQNDNAQSNAGAMAITNVADSAANIGQNVVGVNYVQLHNYASQSNAQVAESSARAHTRLLQNDSDTANARAKDKDRQNVNNGSVQLNDNAQKGAHGLAITNAATSALNVGQNVAGIIDSTQGAHISQRNDQFADSFARNEAGSTQSEHSYSYRRVVDKDLQNMNNGSVQLSQRAQKKANGLMITNASSSALNSAQNIAGSDYSTIGRVAQRNDQVAQSAGENKLTATQFDVDYDGFRSYPDKDRQNVNNGSVQLNNAAEAKAQGLIVTNAASSAANSAQNIFGAVDSLQEGSVAQANDQYAVDSTYNEQDAMQIHRDDVGVDVNKGRKDANNGSVQLNDHAQNKAIGLMITNVGASAFNGAQNIFGSSNGRFGVVTQSNLQSATNF